MERELEQNGQAMSELGRDTDRAASKMDKLKAKAREMNESLRKAGDGISDAGEKMSMGVTAPIIAGIALATEGTRDFRMDLTKLRTNARSVGQDMAVLNKGMAEMYAVTGEVDSNVEGFSNILATGFRNDDILKIMEGLAGASIKWSDTLKFEGIADGLQETLATGKSIGPFDEMLSRAGVNLDDWNVGLQKAIESGRQHQYVLETLANLGLPGVYEEYKKTNKELYESGKAHYEMQVAMGDLGTKLDPIVTKIIKTVTDLIDKFNALPPSVQDSIIKVGLIAAAIGPVLVVVGKGIIFFSLFGDKLLWLAKPVKVVIDIVSKFSGGLIGLATRAGPAVIGFITRLGPMIAGINPIVAGVVLVISGLIAIFKRLWDTSPAFRNWIRELGDGFSNYLKDRINGFVDQINFLIDLANKLPGVDVEHVGKLTKSSGTSGWSDFRQLPGNAKGTRDWRGGWTWVGEKGPELAWLPRGTDIRSHSESQAMMQSQTIHHTGKIRVEGVNTQGQLVAVAQILAGDIQRNDRRLPNRVSLIPI